MPCFVTGVTARPLWFPHERGLLRGVRGDGGASLGGGGECDARSFPLVSVA